MTSETTLPKLLLWGAGAHGRVIHDLAWACGYREIAFADDHPAADLVCGSRVRRPDDERLREYTHFVVAIGDNRVRARCFEEGLRRGLKAALLIHPSAVVSPSAVIGSGTMVLPLVAVGGRGAIGQDCILNTACVVEHDSELRDHVHISPGAVLGGEVTVEPFGHIGMGATVLSRLRIGQDSVLGAGAVLTKDVSAGWVAVGVPAKPLRGVVRS